MSERKRRLRKVKWDPVGILRSMARRMRSEADDLINQGYSLRRKAEVLEEQAGKLSEKKKLRKLLKRAGEAGTK